MEASTREKGRKEKMNVTLIIPTWNLSNRGTDRIKWLLESLKGQGADVNVADGSPSNSEQAIIQDITCYFGYADYQWQPNGEFNKPILVNWGGWQGVWRETEYLCFTDADYLFSPGLIEAALKIASPERFIYKGVELLSRNAVINETTIREWKFPRVSPNSWPPEIACGAFMFHHRSFFEKSGGMDERMSGMCGMDEDYFKRAKLAGLELVHLDEGQILHQWHPTLKRVETPEMRRNWKLRDQAKNVNWKENI